MTCFLLLAMNCLCGIPMPQKEFNSIWRPINNRGWVNLTIPVGQPNHTYYSVLDIMRTLAMFVLRCAKIPPVGSRPFLVAGYFHRISMEQIPISAHSIANRLACTWMDNSTLAVSYLKKKYIYIWLRKRPLNAAKRGPKKLKFITKHIIEKLAPDCWN